MFQRVTFILILVAFISSCKKDKDDFTIEKNPFNVFPKHLTQQVLLENIVSESSELSFSNYFLVESLKVKYPQLINVNFHKLDWLETPATNELIDLLGGISTIPIAASNRLIGKNTIYNQDNFTFLFPINWDLAISRAYAQTPPMSLAIESSINEQQIASASLYIATPSAILEDTRLGCYLVQDSIQSIFQVGVPSGNSFKHEQVLVESLYPLSGEKIDLSAIEDSSITKVQLKSMDIQAYVKENLYLVAFLFKYDTDFRKIKIYNAIKVKLGGVKFWNQ
ncbi:MAG TPA: Omp28-related outer membrane protein [Chitinophagaceae bacterium]|nr:Omp28-related outer membrane protein [Chitinophagaceae bacterium]